MEFRRLKGVLTRTEIRGEGDERHAYAVVRSYDQGGRERLAELVAMGGVLTREEDSWYDGRKAILTVVDGEGGTLVLQDAEAA